MLGTKILEEIGKKVSDVLSKTPAKDIEKNIRAILSAALSKLNLVTREEFNLQHEILIDTRQALDRLQKKMDHIESTLKIKKTALKK